MIINDANGTPALVNDKGKLETLCITLPLSAHSADEGNAYSVVYNIDPNVAGDFLYIKNSSDNPLRIYKIKGYIITTGGLFTVKTGVTGTPTTGIDLTPVNSLIGSGKTAEGTFNRNTSTASMALTGGNTYDIFYHGGSNAVIEREYPAEITLEKNQTFCMTNATDPASVMTWVVYFYYHEKL